MPPSKVLAIVADDLTGLQAVAAEFCRRGLRVHTFLAPGDVSVDDAADIVGIDTHSRHLGAVEAAETVRRAVTHLRSLGVRHVYKQADSGMQGSLATEIAAAADALGAPGVIYAPSCPVLGRVMLGARQLDGQGLDVDVKSLWRMQTGTEPSLCRASEWAEAQRQRPARTWLADARDDSELMALAESAWPLHDQTPPWLLAGSVGLAAALARHWQRRVPSSEARSVLIVAGSQQAQTQRQIDVLAQAVDAATLGLPDSAFSEADARTWVARACDVLNAGRHLIAVPSPSPSAAERGAGGYPLITESSRWALEHNLRMALRMLLNEAGGWPITGVLVAGGATSDLVSRDVLQIRQFDVRAWLAPGVAGAVALLPDARRLPVEPPRISRRPFALSQADTADSLH